MPLPEYLLIYLKMSIIAIFSFFKAAVSLGNPAIFTWLRLQGWTESVGQSG